MRDVAIKRSSRSGKSKRRLISTRPCNAIGSQLNDAQVLQHPVLCVPRAHVQLRREWVELLPAVDPQVEMSCPKHGVRRPVRAGRDCEDLDAALLVCSELAAEVVRGVVILPLGGRLPEIEVCIRDRCAVRRADRECEKVRAVF